MRLGAMLFRRSFRPFMEGLHVPPPSHGLGVGTLFMGLFFISQTCVEQVWDMKGICFQGRQSRGGDSVGPDWSSGLNLLQIPSP